MPKKLSGGENSKAVAARDKKAAAKAESAGKATKAEEDQYWDAAGDGKKSKAQAKKAEEAKRKEEAAAKKLEAKRLAEQEEAELSRSAAAKKPGKVSGPKVTSHQLRLQSEQERRQLEAEAAKKQAAGKRLVGEDDYAALVEVENVNRAEDVVEARSLDAALAALTTGDKEEKHPERRAKAAWNAYYEAQLPVLRSEKPGLKMQQYKDMIWKTWQKAPENPFNQVAK